MRRDKRVRSAELLISRALLPALLLVGLFVVGSRATPVLAATINVDDGGIDSPTCGDPSAPCLTIPYATATRAAVGDTVSVWAGTYTETITLRAGIVISGAGAAHTFIDGEGVRGPMITASGSAIDPSTVLRGVTIRRGTAVNGGGLHISNGASPLIEDCVISENVATSSGGGLYVFGTAVLTLRDTDVISNTSGAAGGGMYQTFAGASRLDLFGGRFEGNETTSGNGGGLWIANTVALTGTEFVNNRAAYRGGGLYQSGITGRAELSGGLIEGNDAGVYYGGGLGAEGTAVLSGTQVIGNSAGQLGGGVWANYAEVIGASFVDNRSNLRGGGLFADYSVVMTGTSMIGNTVPQQGGGVGTYRHAYIINSLFSRNSAYAGAAVWMWGSEPVLNELKHLTIMSPTVGSAYPTAAAILVHGQTTATITNTIVTGYPYAVEAYRSQTAPQGGTVYEDYNLYYNLGTSRFNENGGSIDTGTHSLHDLDPLFVDPAQDDYHLTTESPALDAGAFSWAVDDIDGDTRSANTAQPDAPDIGCDENKALTVRRPIAATMTFGAACARMIFTDTGSLSAVIATVVYTYPAVEGTGNLLPRYYVIVQEGEGPFTARLQLCYTDEELQQSGIADEDDLRLWHLTAAGWTSYPSTVDGIGNVISAESVTTVGHWALATEAPTAVQLASLRALTYAERVFSGQSLSSKADSVSSAADRSNCGWNGFPILYRNLLHFLIRLPCWVCPARVVPGQCPL